MQIKEVIAELCKLKPKKRIEYICEFLKKNSINFNLQFFENGTNIEVPIKGLKPDKEIIFFAHHDIYNPEYQGANDNVSSVGVLLNLINFYKLNTPPYSLKIVFNDKEEMLGALISNISLGDKNKIIESIGSYYYLKKFNNKENILGVIILELSGIGDGLFFASRSGNINCDSELNDFLMSVSKNNNYNFIHLPISNTDLISVHANGLTGTVIGAIPINEGKKYLEGINGKNNIMPHIWNNTHKSTDNIFTIQEKALDMIYNFLIDAVSNFDKYKNT